MGVQTMIDGVNTLWKEDLSTAKEARNVNSFYFPHTSLLLQNPYLKIAKKSKMPPIRFFNVFKNVQKIFKKLKNNFLYHLFLLILPNVKHVYACLTIFSLRTTTTGKRTPAAATKLQKTF